MRAEKIEYMGDSMHHAAWNPKQEEQKTIRLILKLVNLHEYASLKKRNVAVDTVEHVCCICDVSHLRCRRILWMDSCERTLKSGRCIRVVAIAS